tara:strand:+ start:97 stop:618 length:522 start_codon:yes stop_codon:yes gene_type:complete
MKDVRNGRNAPAMTIESAAVLCSRFEKVSKVERARKKTERFARRAARRRATGLSFFKSLDSSAAAATAAGETFDFSDVLAAMDDDTAREEELSFKRDLDNFRLQGISRALNVSRAALHRISQCHLTILYAPTCLHLHHRPPTTTARARRSACVGRQERDSRALRLAVPVWRRS